MAGQKEWLMKFYLGVSESGENCWAAFAEKFPENVRRFEDATALRNRNRKMYS